MSLVILQLTPREELLSKSFFVESLKQAIRMVTGKTRGPQSVLKSVLRGLDALRYPYLLNPNAKEIKDGDTIWINSSIGALKWAIKFKEQNPNVKLIVGPNLVITPDEHNGIIFNKEIDIILQPSVWTKKLYANFYPKDVQRIKVWPAGVQDPYNGADTVALPQKEHLIIVYQKNAPDELFNSVIQHLRDKQVPFHIVKYGTFVHEDFLSKLEKAQGMIYLSSSESQGIALQEAWIRNVPTLVWDKGVWQYQYSGNEINFPHIQISCPYLTPEAGITFRNNADFAEKYEEFISRIKDFTPRSYSMRTLSDKVTTQIYLDIINSL